jgi:hypothetical protein
MDWKPIETAPRDGTRIVITDGRWVDISRYVVSERIENGKAVYRHEGWTASMSALGMRPDPTHWLPMPALPAPKSFADAA